MVRLDDTQSKTILQNDQLFSTKLCKIDPQHVP